jgi:hypothetical protein
MIIVPVVIWLVWNVNRKIYQYGCFQPGSEKPYIYLLQPVLLFILFFNYIRNGYIDLVLLFILILLFALQISNFFIKSSMHTAFNIFVAALFFTLDWKIGLVWLGLPAW